MKVIRRTTRADRRLAFGDARVVMVGGRADIVLPASSDKEVTASYVVQEDYGTLLRAVVGGMPIGCIQEVMTPEELHDFRDKVEHLAGALNDWRKS